MPKHCKESVKNYKKREQEGVIIDFFFHCECFWMRGPTNWSRHNLGSIINIQNSSLDADINHIPK